MLKGVCHSPSSSLVGSFRDLEGPVGPDIAKGQVAVLPSTVKLGLLRLLFLF